MSDQQTETRTPAEIRRDIERTREELADTAAALAHKTDVKARAQERIDEIKSHATERVHGAKKKVTGVTPSSVTSAAGSTKQTVRSNPVPAAAAAAALLGFALGYLIAHRDS